MKRLAERQRYPPAAIPAQFDNQPLERRQVERALEPGRRAAGVNDNRRSDGGLAGQGETDAERARNRLARRILIDELDLATNSPRGNVRNQATDRPAADHGHAIVLPRLG